MGFSKDSEGGENVVLSLVAGTQPANSDVSPEAADKATLTKLAQLRQEHRDLDQAIEALRGAGPVDQLQLTRLKKRKLMLRDQIAKLEDDIVPDIIA
ncbi:MAG: YdcH family protein [Alphaproteobacteria bacterium]|nr:YdcH family protein [Alphaproteobacteria bacterium]